MDYKKLNSWLNNLNFINSKDLEYIEKQVIKEIKDPDGEQGEEGVFYKIYRIKSEDNLYLRVEYYTDSYGYGEFIRGVQFVQPKEKQVVIYETI